MHPTPSCSVCLFLLVHGLVLSRPFLNVHWHVATYFYFIDYVVNSDDVPSGSSSRGGNVTVYVGHKPTELAHSFFYFVLVCISLFMALSTVFHSINSPDSSPFFHSVLPVLFLPYWSFELYFSL